MNIDSINTLKEIVNPISYKDWNFRVGEMGNGYFLQVKFDAADTETGETEEQSGRKWYISKYMTKSEVVQTAFLACLKAEEHECRENFCYHKQPIYCPHFSVDQLLTFSENAARDKRN